jgi:hypothetical protein
MASEDPDFEKKAMDIITISESSPARSGVLRQ